MRFRSDIYQENKELAITAGIRRIALNLVSTGGYYGAYVVVLMRDPGGRDLGRDVHFSDRCIFPLARTISRGFSRASTTSPSRRIFLKDLFEFFEMQPTIRSLPEALPAPRPIRQGFEFRNVGFAYPGSEPHGRAKHQFLACIQLKK